MPRNRTNNASAVSVPNFDRVILRGGGKTITRYIQVMRLPHECSDWLSMARDRHLAAWFTSDWIPYLYFTIMISTGQEPWRERNDDTKKRRREEEKKRRREEEKKSLAQHLKNTIRRQMIWTTWLLTEDLFVTLEYFLMCSLLSDNEF